MPRVMTVISYVGMAAMLWVGGHILLEGSHELGAAVPYAWVHHLEHSLAGIPALGGAIGWLAATLCSMVLGIVVGAVVLLVVGALSRRRGGAADAQEA
jgi:predicted DNA repair protein MutK